MEHFKTIGVDAIPNGQKFVALYADGGGADMYLTTDNGDLLDSELDLCLMAGVEITDEYLLDKGYQWWIPLPDTFKIWGERE